MSGRPRLGLKPWLPGRSGNVQGSSRRARARAVARRLGHQTITALLAADAAENGDDPRERWLEALRSTLSPDDTLELVFPAPLLSQLSDDDLAALERLGELVRAFHLARQSVARTSEEKLR